MPNTRAAAKALRQAKKKTKSNEKSKETLTFLRRSVRKAFENKDLKKAAELTNETIRHIDKAVQKKVLKKNTGSRIKSRMMATLNKATKK